VRSKKCLNVATLMEFFYHCQQHWKILHFIPMASQPSLSAGITFLSTSHATSSIWHLSLTTSFHFLETSHLDDAAIILAEKYRSRYLQETLE
jgi:hypothetical protein